MNYSEFREERRTRLDAFPMGWAFSNEQFEQMIEKLGTTDLLRIGAGGFIRKSDRQAFLDMNKKLDDEEKEYMADPEQFRQAVRSELANHEWQIAGDDETVLEALGLTYETMTSEQTIIFEQTKTSFYNECIDNDWF